VQPGERHDDLHAIWRDVTDQLATGLPASTFQLWIAPLRPISVQGTTLCVAAPDATRAWVQRRYAGSLEAALREQASPLEHISLVPPRPARGQAGKWRTAVEPLAVDPRHTFERFVIGDANRLAHAAALAVAELPGEAYNPLFLHGAPGLGKTHLLGAIIDYLGRRRGDLNVHYTTAERFTTEFVAALREQGPERFKRRYRELDALLIDDVQTLEGKDHTQEEFVHTFNALHGSGKQIVLSSDRPPEALGRLAERLRDRFQWGLAAELGSPDLRTRTTLLWRMAANAAVETPEPLALGELAALAAGNVRLLEGAMTRVIAFSSMLGEPITGALVQRALNRPSGHVPPADHDAESPSTTAIQEAACSALGVSRSDLLSTNRTARVSSARQIAIYLARELTPLSVAQIARDFNRDHSTVLHAIRAVSGRLEVNSDVTAALQRTRRLLDQSTILAGDPHTPSPSVHNPLTPPPHESSAPNPNPSP
jgi:chromosomal replication initiator protein